MKGSGYPEAGVDDRGVPRVVVGLVDVDCCGRDLRCPGQGPMLGYGSRPIAGSKPSVGMSSIPSAGGRTHPSGRYWKGQLLAFTLLGWAGVGDLRGRK